MATKLTEGQTVTRRFSVTSIHICLFLAGRVDALGLCLAAGNGATL